MRHHLNVLYVNLFYVIITQIELSIIIEAMKDICSWEINSIIIKN
jgi:hypothetical protein